MQAALAPMADLVVTGPPALKHAPLYRYSRFIAPMYEKVCGIDLEVMAIVREPVSWLGSWYRYRRRAALDGHANSTAGITFDGFVQAYCREKPPAFADVGSQQRFLGPQAGGNRVAHLFAYEDQEGIRSFLSDRLGTIPEFERLNVSPEAPLDLSDATLSLLRRAHAETFALYESIPAPRHL
jgi:hypothetical protein